MFWCLVYCLVILVTEVRVNSQFQLLLKVILYSIKNYLDLIYRFSVSRQYTSYVMMGQIQKFSNPNPNSNLENCLNSNFTEMK